MTDTANPQDKSDQLDMGEEVRRLTVQALTHGQFDMERLKLIASRLSETTGASVRMGGKEIKDKIRPAISTLDEALSKSAETSKLAIEEALSHISEFSKRELPKTAGDFEALSKLFLDAAAQAASGANALAKSVLSDLAGHAKQASSSIGGQAGDTITPAKDSLAHLGSESVRVASQISQNAVSQFAQVASGILAGLADTLAARAQKPSAEQDNKTPE